MHCLDDNTDIDFVIGRRNGNDSAEFADSTDRSQDLGWRVEPPAADAARLAFKAHERRRDCRVPVPRLE